jgi:hypothetical protein
MTDVRLEKHKISVQEYWLQFHELAKSAKNAVMWMALCIARRSSSIEARNDTVNSKLLYSYVVLDFYLVTICYIKKIEIIYLCSTFSYH